MKKTALFLAVILCLLAGCGKAPASSAAPETPVVSQPAEQASLLPAEEPEKAANLPLLQVEFAKDSLLQSGSCQIYTVEESEYTQYLAAWVGETVTNFRLQSMLLNDQGYAADAVLHKVEQLSPESPFVAGVVFYGDMTGYGFAFTDALGAPHQYVVTLSGMDGSVILEEITPAP